MRILIINRHPSHTVGGSEIQCEIIFKELRNRGYDVYYLCPGGHKDNCDSLIDRCISVGDNPKEIIKAINEIRPKLIYWRYKRSFLHKVISNSDINPRIFVYAIPHINLTKKMLPYRKESSIVYFRKLYRHYRSYSVLNKVGEIIVINKDFLPILNKFSNVSYIPNAMVAESDHFRWHRPYCIWVANIKPAKRPELAVNISDTLRKRGVDLLMVGHMQSSQYEWMQEEEGLPDNCHYLGAKSLKEVNGIIAGSLFHIHTCMPEGFGNIFIQAWLHGRPSVSFGFDPSGYIEKNGLGLVSGENERVFREQVQFLIENDEIRNTMGNNARVFATDKFSVTNMVGSVERIFRRAVGKLD